MKNIQKRAPIKCNLHRISTGDENQVLNFKREMKKVSKNMNEKLEKRIPVHRPYKEENDINLFDKDSRKAWVIENYDEVEQMMPSWAKENTKDNTVENPVNPSNVLFEIFIILAIVILLLGGINAALYFYDYFYLYSNAKHTNNNNQNVTPNNKKKSSKQNLSNPKIQVKKKKIMCAAFFTGIYGTNFRMQHDEHKKHTIERKESPIQVKFKPNDCIIEIKEQKVDQNLKTKKSYAAFFPGIYGLNIWTKYEHKKHAAEENATPTQVQFKPGDCIINVKEQNEP